jgi:hypothetical protein
VRVSLIVPALLLAHATTLAAQETGAGGRTVYQAAYFTQFSPSTGLDIVRRVPGFTLDLGQQEVRGFSQAAGNVVINGSRPSAKTDTLETILARIPASQVARVEVGPGDLFGSDFSGKPQVVNLVLISTGGLSGTLNATVRHDFTGQITPDGNVSVLYRRGASTFNLAGGYANQHTPEEGYDRVTSLPSGDLLEFRRKFNDIADHEGNISGAWGHDGGENRTAHANFRWARGAFLLDQTNHVIPALGLERHDVLSQDYLRRNFELGGDVTRPLWGGGIKLIGLITRNKQLNDDISLNRLDEDHVLGGFSQDNDSQRNETIGRLVWNRSNLRGWSVETGGEGALNTLDSDVNLYLLDSQGGRTRIDLPVDQAKVTEWRGEVFVNGGRSLSPTLRMDLGLTWEISKLTVTGDTDARRVLNFLKPKAVFDWKKNKWHAQLSLQRTVAQLNFYDFVSSAELTNDRVDAGNADLVPQRAWELLATVERPILGDGLAKIEAGYNLISQVQDRVPLEGGFDAPGNLGTGRQAFVRATLAAPLSRFGIKGGRLDLTGTLQDTSVEDPYTHQKRSFSNYTKWEFEGSFRQDLDKFAWGFTVFGNPARPFYWQTEIDIPDGKDPYITAFAEYRPSKKTTVTFGLDNVLAVPGQRRRTFYAPDRSNPDPFLFEFRTRDPHVRTYIALKQSFG